jgi:hypothetical protein
VHRLPETSALVVTVIAAVGATVANVRVR